MRHSIVPPGHTYALRWAVRNLSWLTLLLAVAGCSDAVPGSAPLVHRPNFSEAVAVPLLSAGGTDDDQFASAVAVAEDSVWVGAPGDRAGAAASGAIQLFHFNGQKWVAQAKLKSLTPEEDGRVGAAIAASDGRILVGAPERDQGVGGALVFTAGHGYRQEWMMPSTPTDGAHFGHAVSLDGPTALVGEPFVGAPRAGTVAVFDRVGQSWQHTQGLEGGEETTNFGRAVAVSGDLAVIGANDAAFSWLRSEQGWSEHHRLVASPHIDNLGVAVALDANTAAIAAQPAGDGGSVFLFVRQGNAWLQEAQLSAPQSHVDDGFGQALALQGDVLLVGAPGQGAAYVFEREGHDWSLQTELTAPDATPGFGSSVAMNGPVVAIAAKTESSTGAAYVFRGR